MQTGTNGLGVNCLPCGITVLSHVDAAGDVVALDNSFERPGDRISRNLHIAMEFDLVGVDHAFELCVVDLTVLRACELVAALLDREPLLAGAAGVLNGDGPHALDRAGGSRWDYGIFVMAGFGKGLVDGVRYDSILAGIHHVWHDGD